MVLTVNIRSIHRNIDSLLLFIANADVEMDVIVLTECWINKHSIIPCIKNYNFVSSTQTLNQNDGVIVYVRKNLPFVSYEPSIAEGNCIVVTLCKEYTIICSYRPPCFVNPSKYLDIH